MNPTARALLMATITCLTGALSAGYAFDILDFKGIYSFTGGTAEQTAIAHAIERAAGEVNMLIRSIVRKKLRESNPPYTSVEFRFGDAPEFIRNGTDPVRFHSNPAQPVDWRRGDGKVFKVTQQYEAATGTIVQQFVGKDGVRENRFTLAEGGKTLRMRVTITSTTLKSPLSYQLTYTRS